jgi:hypothetical protein
VPEETDVRRGGGADAPVEFRWNGELHQVRAVLSHHRIRSSPSARPPSARPPGAVRPVLPAPRESEEAAEIEIVDELSARRVARRGPEPEMSDPSPTESPGQSAADLRWHDQEVWRVRAGPLATGHSAAVIPGVFDLRFDWAVGRWTVSRIDILEEEQ